MLTTTTEKEEPTTTESPLEMYPATIPEAMGQVVEVVPEVPLVPEVPEIPSVPEVPVVPEVPEAEEASEATTNLPATTPDLQAIAEAALEEAIRNPTATVDVQVNIDVKEVPKDNVSC